MSGCGCEDPSNASLTRTRAQRRVLWGVLAINLGIFAGEFGTGLWADSTALQADSLDSLGDTLVYGVSLVVLGRSLRARAGAALFKGGLQLVFGLGVLAEVAHKLLVGAQPLPVYMLIAATAALVANLTCLALLTRFRSDDINMRSVWLCSRNDVIGNVSVILTAGVVMASGWAWVDWALGALLAIVFLRTAVQVLQVAWPQYRDGVEPPRTCAS
ncbi:cation efflux family protein [Tahibacter aquaticus]|uniref:Cation efflux family protein n=1 Tax=Tahibacter aquaticus TaxID=520092 RepID=A0A4V3DL69_9GAMM|nr:cation transporter [Tahibacter aquaticus]TDR37715.1 cation efflux family protein [Tahibacter aquaticus]